MMMNLRSLSSSLLLLAGVAWAAPRIDWKPNAGTAEAGARKAGKLLLVFITGPAT